MLALRDPAGEIGAGAFGQARGGDAAEIEAERLRPGAQIIQKSRLA
jgi:hypothetical protein